mmetsp:Transcript_28632/g.31801  ORF Transcript_28632/g.31801 Transcript_28632/m.31801 type:complete len:95 (+) Transcript_28632:76-360(+)
MADYVPQEIKIKVVVVGNAGAGKTSIVRRYTGNKYSTNYLPTIGVDFATKKLTVPVGNKKNNSVTSVVGHCRTGAIRIHDEHILSCCKGSNHCV